MGKASSLNGIFKKIKLDRGHGSCGEAKEDGEVNANSTCYDFVHPDHISSQSLIIERWKI